jgi:hypothetical protein
MKKLFHLTIAAGVAGMLALPAAAMADNSAFASAADAVIGAAAITNTDGFAKVLSTTIKNSGTPKDMIIGLSYETMLMTNTAVKSQGGNKSQAMANAEIDMYVMVDGEMATPGIITFDRRQQTLWAQLGGVLNCVDENGDNIMNSDECTLTDEEIGLILETKAAHTFNFLASNIGPGSHTIEAYALLKKDGKVEEGDGSSDASATLGSGTLSVWQVQDSNTN